MARNRKRAKDRRTHRPQPVATARAEHEQSRSSISASERDEALRPIGQDAGDTAVDALGDGGAEEGEARLDAGDAARYEVAGAHADAEPEFEAPASIAHATPDVDLAEAQLALGRPELARGAQAEVDEELEREAADAGPDASGGSRGGRGGGALAARAPAAPQRRIGTFSRLITFLQGSWRELQRVQWPDRRQVMQATGVVIGFVIVAGVFLGVVDTLSGHVMNLILTGKW